MIYNRVLAKVIKSQNSCSGSDDIHVPVLMWFKQADVTEKVNQIR